MLFAERDVGFYVRLNVCGYLDRAVLVEYLRRLMDGSPALGGSVEVVLPYVAVYLA